MIARSRNLHRRIVVLCCLVLLTLTLFLGGSAVTQAQPVPPTPPCCEPLVHTYKYYSDPGAHYQIGQYDDYRECGGGEYMTGQWGVYFRYSYAYC